MHHQLAGRLCQSLASLRLTTETVPNAFAQRSATILRPLLRLCTHRSPLS